MDISWEELFEGIRNSNKKAFSDEVMNQLVGGNWRSVAPALFDAIAVTRIVNAQYSRMMKRRGAMYN